MVKRLNHNSYSFKSNFVLFVTATVISITNSADVCCSAKGKKREQINELLTHTRTNDKTYTNLDMNLPAPDANFSPSQDNL
jgi:hypothetical protein